MRLFALVNAAAALGLLAAVITGSAWLPGSDGWTALLLLAALCGLGALPYVWAMASELETGRAHTRALRVAALSDLAMAVGLLCFAAANVRAGWLDGRWTVGLVVLAASWLLGAAGILARLRYLSRSGE